MLHLTISGGLGSESAPLEFLKPALMLQPHELIIDAPLISQRELAEHLVCRRIEHELCTDQGGIARRAVQKPAQFGGLQ